MMTIITQAMIFAAGFGKRLKPLTDQTPKPLIPIGNTTCLDFTLRKLKEAGIQKIVVNTHHLADQIHQHLKNHPEIIISHEPEILETGGGLINALPHFNKHEPIFIVNGDIWWQDGQISMLQNLQDTWDSEKMDILLLLVPKENSIGYFGKGDYFLKDGGRAEYRGQHDSAPYVYPGVCIVNPSLLMHDHFLDRHASLAMTEKARHCEERERRGNPVFSLKLLFDHAETNKYLYGLIHDSLWGDIGSPKGLEDVRERCNIT